MADATPERWLPIPGHEGFYEASDRGRIRSCPRTILCRNGVLRPLRGKILAPGSDNGRLIVNLHGRDGRPRTRKVHHLVLEAFVGPRPEGAGCCHWDDDFSNNRLDNLRWATHTDNMQDCLRNGGNSRQKRTHCPRQHPLGAPNLVPGELLKKGRKCLACCRATSMRRLRVAEGSVKKEEVDMQALSDLYYAEVIATGGRPRVRPHWIRHDIPLPRLKS